MNRSAHLVKRGFFFKKNEANFGTTFTMDNEHNYCPKTYIQLIETTNSEQQSDEKERRKKNHGKIN